MTTTTPLGVLTAAVLGAACSTTIAARRPLTEQTVAEVNDAIAGQPATLTFKKTAVGLPGEALTVKVGHEATTLRLQLQPGSPEYLLKSVPTAELEQISVVNHGRGLLDGFGFGVLAAPALGLAFAYAGAALADNRIGCDSCRIVGFFNGALVGIVTALFAGPIVGALVGHRTTVVFDPPKPPPPRPQEP